MTLLILTLPLFLVQPRSLIPLICFPLARVGGTLQVWLKIPVTTAMIDPQSCHTSTRATDESFIVTQFIVETDVIHKKISSWDGDISEIEFYT